MQIKTNLFCILLVYSYLCMVLENSKNASAGLKMPLNAKFAKSQVVKQ